MSIGILGVEWTRHLELKQTLSQESGNTNYIEKEIRLLRSLKLKLNMIKDPISKSINKYLEKRNLMEL